MVSMVRGGIEMIKTIVNDATININLIKATTIALLYPLLKKELEYKQGLAKYKEQSIMPQRLNKLEKRVSNLEARQILTEAELVLVEGQFDRVSL